MKKLIKKLFAGTLLMALVVVSGLATILFFPEPLFADKLKHGPFSVYADTPIDAAARVVLDDALALVKDSELYDPAYRYDVFLCYGTLFNDIDSRLLGRGPSARAMDNNVVVKVAVDFARNRAFPTFHQPCEADLTILLAHELVHGLQDYKYGKVRFNPFMPPEFWKLEGYPEYVSRRGQRAADDYSLVKDIGRYLELERSSADGWMAIHEGGCQAPKYYYKSKLMMEYLIDVRHRSYDEILSDTVSAHRVFGEMMAWRNSKFHIQNSRF